MDLTSIIAGLPLAAAEGAKAEDESGSFLVSPDVGLMIWTFLVFGLSLYILKKVVFPRIQEALDKRQKIIEDSIDAAENTRVEADKLLAEYRERLAKAREQAEDIVSRARKAAEAAEASALSDAKAKREELLESTKRDIQAETRRAIQEIRNEVADLTILATEKVTRKTLDEDDQRRLVEEALSELDFSALARAGSEGPANRHRARITDGPLMEEIAEVYGRSLFAVAQEHDKLDAIREQLGQFADALQDNRDLAIFFFSPYFSTPEKKEGLTKTVEDAEPTLINFLELLIEKHRMPAVFRIRRYYDGLWEQENKILPVQISTATELDKATVKQIGDRIAKDTGQKIEVTADVDPDILGGIVLRVGNSILDASIRNRLDNLRKHVARGA